MTTTTRVNAAVLRQGIADYIAATGNSRYNPFVQNSNYFVNSVISRAGGNPVIPGAGPAPAGGGGPVPYFSVLVLAGADR